LTKDKDTTKISDSVAEDNLDGLGLKKKTPSYHTVPRRPPPRSTKTYEDYRNEYPDIPDFLKREKKEEDKVEVIKLSEPKKMGYVTYEEGILISEDKLKSISNNVMKAISDALDDRS
jgi:hypothetical protein